MDEASNNHFARPSKDHASPLPCRLGQRRLICALTPRDLPRQVQLGYCVGLPAMRACKCRLNLRRVTLEPVRLLPRFLARRAN